MPPALLPTSATLASCNIFYPFSPISLIYLSYLFSVTGLVSSFISSILFNKIKNKNNNLNMNIK